MWGVWLIQEWLLWYQGYQPPREYGIDSLIGCCHLVLSEERVLFYTLNLSPHRFAVEIR